MAREEVKVVLLDTNCVIYLAEGVEPYATELGQLLGRHRAGALQLVAAGITASENSARAGEPASWEAFMALLSAAGLAEVRVLAPMGYYDVSFWGHALWVGEPMQVLERKVHEVLAPSFDIEDRSNHRKWLNTKCDVQLVWSAIWHEADLLVTNDKGILSKADRLVELGARVASPRVASESLS